MFEENKKQLIKKFIQKDESKKDILIRKMEEKYKKKFKIQKKELKNSIVQPLQVYLMRNPRNIKANIDIIKQDANNTQLNSAFRNSESRIEDEKICKT